MPERNSETEHSSSTYDEDEQEAVALLPLPPNGVRNALLVGVVAGVLCSIESIIIAFANTANYAQMSPYANAPDKVPASLALTLASAGCLTFFIGLLICLMAGFVTGKRAVLRRYGFLAGFVAGIVTYGISFLLNYIPNYPGHLSSSVSMNAGIVLTGLVVVVILFLIWGLIAGLVSLFGAWLATRKHPYFVAE